MKYKINGLYYAIKKISKNNKEISNKQLLREIELQKELNHDNIVHLYDNFEDIQYYYLVLEYIPNGNLKEKIDKIKPKPIQEDEVINIFEQILNGLIYLQYKNIIH